MNRRELLAGMTVAGTALVLGPGEAARAETPKAPAAPPGPEAPPRPSVGTHPIAPLPFNPAKLKGLSEKLLRSHHENNYGGAVKNLNKVEEELARTNKDTPAFVIGGLKERELTFTNSMILHEEHFRATGASLGGGSGWVILAYNFQTGQPHTYWSGHHTQSLASGLPLLVMDMYEHAYQMDYGAAAAKYIDAFFQNIHWDEVNARLERARKAAAALRG
jgi:superoxide dismutase, Fe-Mn family